MKHLSLSFILALLVGMASCSLPEGPQGPTGPQGASILPVFTDGFIRFSATGAINTQAGAQPISLSREYHSHSSFYALGTIQDLGNGNKYIEFYREESRENSAHFQIETDSTYGKIIGVRAMFSLLEKLPNNVYISFSIVGDTDPSMGEDSASVSNFQYNPLTGRVSGNFVVTRVAAPWQQALTLTGDFDSQALSVVQRPSNP